ncbi:MAG: ATP-grasp domain-containing protein [Alphaproteobacteria bacterium]
MNFEEHAAKPLIAAAGITVPLGRLCRTPAEAKQAADEIGPVVVKAQVPTGKRGKAGGIARAGSPREAEEAATAILGMTIGDHRVEKVLVEAQASIAKEFYAAVLNHQETKSPLLLFSTEGGMEVEEITANHPDKMAHLPVDMREGVDDELLEHIFAALGLEDEKGALVEFFLKLFDAYRVTDAELIEINPLALTSAGDLVALDCKLTVDDSGLARRPELEAEGVPEPLTELEARAKALGLKFIELDGEVGVLANGAGLTMTTMDAIRHYGGRPANFLEIGGDAYTKGKPALELVLANPRVKSLLVNFCGAFARTDVMVGGLLEAWAELKPDLPVFFTIHGTGEDEAIALVREKLGIEPFDLMDHAIEAAVEASAEGFGGAGR